MEKTDICGGCGHAKNLHVPGHECAGTSYEGGKACSCADLGETECEHGTPACVACVEGTS